MFLSLETAAQTQANNAKDSNVHQRIIGVWFVCVFVRSYRSRSTTFFSYVMVTSDDWNDGCWGWWVWCEWWWGWWWRTCEVDGSVIDGHWWCIFGVWCMPNPKPIWWWLWCVCGGPWLWLLLEFALFAFDCCLCEFFLFFILRFWNLKRELMKVSERVQQSLHVVVVLPNLNLSLREIQISRQLPALLLRNVSVEQKFFLEL